MLKFLKGIFSSSLPVPPSSSVAKEEEEEEEEDKDSEKGFDSDAQDRTVIQYEDQHKDADPATHPDDAMDYPSTTNGTPKMGNGEPAISSAVKGSSGKKKNKLSAHAQQSKNQKKKERKRKKKQGLDSSAMDWSVMGDDLDARGGNAGEDDDDDDDAEEPEQSFVSTAAVDVEDSFVSPDLSRVLGSLFNDLPAKAASEEPKPKKPKKSKRASKKQSNAEGSQANDVASQLPREPEPVEEETQDMRDLIRKERKANRKKKAKKSKEPESGSSRQSQSGELGLAEKINKKAKRKARLSPGKPSQESVAALQDEDDTEALLHQSRTPALFNHWRPHWPIRPTEEDIVEAEAQIQSSAWSTAQVDPDAEEDADEEEPKRSSKKALGKRKASNTAMESNSKRRKSKAKGEAATAVSQYGFVSSSETSSHGATKPMSGNRSASHEASGLARTAAIMYASQMEEEDRASPGRETPAFSSIDLNSSQQRRPTPAFTPVNPRIPLQALVVPATARDPDEPPPSSQRHAESEPELPQNTPSSTERRKRHLPVGEVEPSQAIAKAHKTGKGQSEVPERQLKSMSPKSAESKAKTLAPKLPANSQATTILKGARIPKQDIELINVAVEAYREEHDLEKANIIAMIHGDALMPDAKKFWTYMFAEFPHLLHRTMRSHCRRRFHNFDARGSWTEEADQDLKDAYMRNPGKWKQIGGELNRFAEDCRDRWRNYLICGDTLKREYWDKEEEEKLREVVEQLLVLIRTPEYLKSKGASKDDYNMLDWLKVSEMMGRTRSRLQCLLKWKQILEREDAETEDPVASEPISKADWRLKRAEKFARKMRAPEKLDFLYLIRDSKAGKEGSIRWNTIQQDLGLKKRKMALRVCYRNLKEHLPQHEDMKLQDIVSALIDLYEAAAPREPQGFDTFFSPERYHKTPSVQESRSVASRRIASRSVASRSVAKDESEDESEDGDSGDDENNNGEGPSNSKKKRSSNAKENNGDGSSTQQPRLRLEKDRKAAMLSEMDHDNDRTPPKKARRNRKHQSRIKGTDPKESQETAADTAESADEMGVAFQAVKSSQTRSPRVAKTPIMVARTSRDPKRLSAHRAVESEDDAEQMVIEAPSHQSASRIEHDDQLDEDIQPDEEEQQGDEEPESEIPGFDTPRSRGAGQATFFGKGNGIRDGDEDYERDVGLGVKSPVHYRSGSISSDASSIPAVVGQKGGMRERVGSLEL